MNIKFFNGWGISDEFSELITDYFYKQYKNLKSKNIGIGWSLGALNCLQEHEKNPFDALILLSFTPCFVKKNILDLWGMTETEFMFFENLFLQDIDACFKHFSRLVLFPKTEKAEILEISKLQFIVANSVEKNENVKNIEKLKSGLKTLKNWDFPLEKLKKVQQQTPLLWIHGRQDQLMKIPKNIDDFNGRLFENLNVKIIEKTGHHLLQNPQTWQEIHHFLTKMC